MSEAFIKKYFEPSKSSPFNRLSYIYTMIQEHSIDLKHSISFGLYLPDLMEKSTSSISITSINKTGDDEFSNISNIHINDKVIGLQKKINVYTSRSVFKNNDWTLAVFISRNDLDKGRLPFVIGGFAALLCFV